MAQIQQKTGIILKLPPSEFDSRIELEAANKIIQGIDTGIIKGLDLICKIELKRIMGLRLLKDIMDNRKEVTISYTIPYYIFGKEIPLGPGKIITRKIGTDQDFEKYMLLS
ncbi:MAG: hypothetical protein R2685_16260 [Candidatus Nitrosocosmicus sp.]|nr:hypothetical protein [Candidatus Nitrosocosmicus sp.]